MKVTKKSLWLVGFVSAMMLTGCADPNDQISPTTPNGGKEEKDYIPTAAAGVQKDISKYLDPNRLKPFIASTARFSHRSNPFALSAEEIAFDKAQGAERVLLEGGAIGELFEEPEDRLPVAEPMEPQPYRRLSGILIGDSVLAILEESGRSTIVRPGMMLPDTNWRVISIDRDKAVLRREGSTRMPREVEVRLEIGAPFQGGNPAQGNGGGGNPAQGGGPTRGNAAGGGNSRGGGAAGAN